MIFLKYLQHNNCYLRIIYDLRHFPKNLVEYTEENKLARLVNYIYNSSNVIGIIAITYWNWKTNILGEPPSRVAEFHASVSAPWYQYLLGTKWWANKNNDTIKNDYKEYINDLDSVILLDFI